MSHQFFKVSIQNKIATVSIHRPEKVNSLHHPAWMEMKKIFETLDKEPSARVIVLAGEGKLFCAGIDLELLMSVNELGKVTSSAHRSEQLYHLITELQACVNAIEQCSKPVLAAIHNGCIGGGVDIVAACDLRYCTEDAYFTIKEIDMGMVADLGTLQRLPRFVKPAVVTEMALTGRAVKAQEAVAIGLVNNVYENKELMMKGVEEVAFVIASKSPVAIRGTKAVLRHSRDNAVPDGLSFIAQWNAGRLLSDDLTESFKAVMEKRKPQYKD
ncbi:MAG: crotonase/enoyl-CoA hydratase family protein [Bacteroidetes bacterium]|nr:crotonase/enoyl-CoA hydratase family protein [Bacteroidota bacterium]